MADLDRELWKYGIPSKTKHNVAASLKASQDLNNGVFLSNASPVYEQNNVGIYNVPSLTKAIVTINKEWT